MTLPPNDDNELIPPLPEHWDFGGERHPTQVPWSRPTMIIHRLLCIIAFGCASLQTVWERTHTSAWKVTRVDMKDRIQHVNVVAGLFLATVSAFCTTEPPAGSRIFPYTKTVPYCFLLASLSLAAGGLAGGSTAGFIIHKASPVWFREVMMGSRFRIWFTMILLSAPFITILLSIICFSLGLATAASSSEVRFVRLAWQLLGLPQIVTGIMFAWATFWPPDGPGLFSMEDSMC